MSILWNFDKYAKIEMLPFDPACINADCLPPISDHELLLKAGTPLVESSGVVAPLGEDDDPTCFAAEDYHFILTNAQQPNLVKCVTKGYIEKAKVLEAMDAEEDPAADWAEDLAALGLYLVDDLGALPGSGGSGGGSVFIVNAEYNEEMDTYVCDKTWQQISDAFNGDGAVTVIDEIDYNASTGEMRRRREYVLRCYNSELGYSIQTTGASYYCAGANGYPVREVA